MGSNNIRKKDKQNSKKKITPRKAFFITLGVFISVGLIALFALTVIGKSEIKSAETDDQSSSPIVQTITEEDRASQTTGKTGNLDATGAENSSNTESSGTLGTDGDNETVSIAFTGDILFDSGYAIMNRISQNGGSLSGIISDEILQNLNTVDICMVNNEFPYTNGGTPTEGKTYTFHADPSRTSLLTEMGVDIVTLANNHVYDYGETGLLDSLTALNSAGIEYAGAGQNLEEASAIRYFDIDGMKIAIIAATDIEQMDNPDTKGATDTSPGVFRCVDDTLLLDRIKEAHSTGAFTIVFVHWGKEKQQDPTWLQLQQAPEFVNAGADLIIGAHPHILQRIEYVNGVPVVYSIGNFLFNSSTLDTCVINAKVGNGGLQSLQFIPAIQQNCSVSFATGDEKSRIISEMQNISPTISIDDEGYILAK